MNRYLPLIQHIITIASIALVLAISGCASTAQSPLTPGAEPTKIMNTPPSSSGTDIPFQSLAKYYLLGGSLPEPALYLVTDETSLQTIASLIHPDDRATLEQANFSEDAVLAVFWAQPSGGASVSITRIYLADQELVVSLLLQEKDLAFPQVDAETQPYHLVSIASKDLPQTTELRYRLLYGDETLSTGELR